MNRDLVVPCRGSGHRVRLARGFRFWLGARCPLCSSRVDPSRTRRILAWVVNYRRPASRGWLNRSVWLASLAYLCLVVAAALALWGLSDRWWPATILLFGPRWVLSLPLVVLIPGALLFDRPLVWPLALAAAVLAGPVMGYRTGWRSLLPRESAGATLRVASFNARGGDFLLFRASDLLAEWNTDVAVFQECRGSLAEELQDLPGWYVDVRSGLCFASRFEISQVMEMERESLEGAGGSGLVATYVIDLDGSPVHVTNLHLETPRAGFELIRAGRIYEGIPKIQEKSILRDIELRRARRWTDQFSGPQLAAGDFNTPPESRSYREAWGDWTNAFSRVGRGLGGTRLNGWIRARIDHVVVNDAWEVVGAWPGKEVGSDHLPIIAEVRLR